MSILRRISSFAATTLVAVAPLCIGFCFAPLASASPGDTPTTSTSATNPAAQTQDLTKWAQNNCPGGKQFDNDANTNTPIYLGYANGNIYLGYTTTNWGSKVDAKNQFIDTHSDAKFKEKIGTCVRVAAEETGQAAAEVYYGTLFKADESALAASGFSKETKTIFQVTKVKPWDTGTKIESRAGKSNDNYQEMPHSVTDNSSDSGFKTTLIKTENSIDLRFSQSGFYTVYLKAITTDPANPDKSYRAEMAYTFIVGKEASVPKDLQDIADGKDPGGSDNPPTPNPGETTPDTPTPGHGDEGGGTHPGTDPTPNPGDTTPDTPTPGHGDEGGGTKPGTQPTPKPGETTPGTPTPGHGDDGGGTQPGTNPNHPNPAVNPNPRTPNHGDKAGTSSHPGSTPAPRPGAASAISTQNQVASSRTHLQSAAGTATRSTTGSRANPSEAAPLLPQSPADILPNLSKLRSLDTLGADNPPATNPDLDSPSQQGAGDGQGSNSALKFQAANSSTDAASRQWIRSSSLAVFAGGVAIAGLTGIGLLVFSRRNP